MAKIELLQSQKNSIFEKILREKFDPNMFRWESNYSKYSGNFTARLSLKNSKFFFSFDKIVGEFRGEFSPGNNEIIESEQKSNWDDVLVIFVNWLIFLRREIEAPDLWSNYEELSFIDQGKLIENIPNDKFTFQQVEQIAGALETLKNNIDANFELSDEDNEEVDKRLNFIGESAKRLGKLDWANATLGAITSLVTNAIFNPEQAKTLWDMFWNGLRGILQLP